MPERRKHSRVLMWKTGKLSISDHAPDIECAVLDISKGGARILVPITAAIPATFRLMIDGSQEAYYCSLKWKRGARLGVQFEEKAASAQQHPYRSSTSRELAMTRFEDLPGNTRALILAKLAVEMNAQSARSIHHLAKMRETNVVNLWRSICRKAGQPLCALPIEAERRH